MRIFIHVFSLLFFLLICPLVYADDVERPSELSTDSLRDVKDNENPPSPPFSKGGMGGFSEEQFKRAINLINSRSYKESEDILLSFVANDIWSESTRTEQERTYFLLGRLYKEQGLFDKAEDCLKKVVERGRLLKDYALKLLTDVYIAKEEFSKAIETARQIQNKTLLQEAKQTEISTLLALKDEKVLVEVLSQYIKEYPWEWDSKLLLAQLLKNSGKRKEAITLFKEIYINATPSATDAMKELEVMNEASFTREEILGRAENLFEKGNFQKAETTYKEVLKDIDDSTMKDKIIFSIGMCQFKQKQYSMAAESFGLIKGPEAMYWKAKTLYRIDDLDGFNRIIKKFEEEYPKNKYLAELFLVLAGEERRRGKLSEAEEIFKKILNDFPEKTEDALWGLGWINYINGNYEESEKIFSKLTSSIKNNGRYLYWEAKSKEMLSKACMAQKASLNSVRVDPNTEDDACPKIDVAYSRVLEDRGYYGFLVKTRFKEFNVIDKIEFSRPKIPEGEFYERVEALKFLGMNKEAIAEIKMALKFTKDPEEFRYLGQTAIDLGEYKSIIYFAEDLKDREFLPLAYPLGFWDTIKEAAQSEGVDPYLIVALIREESRFDPMAISMAGAVGLMQLMPFTAHRIKRELKIELRDDFELYDIKKNILVGTYYLSLLIREFKELPLAIAAYNAGENALKKWLLDSNHKDIEEFIEDIPFRETRDYIKRVLRSYWQYRALEGLTLLKDKE